MQIITNYQLPITVTGMRFDYEAKTKQGQLQSGAIEASSREAAIDVLQRHDLIILKLQTETETPILSKRIRFFEGVKNKDMVVFLRQLSTLFGSRVPLVESLQILAGQTTNHYFQSVILDLAKELQGGKALSQAMSKYPKVFSGFYISMIKSGEVSGKLEEIFDYLAESMERQYTLNSKVFNALIYPAIVLIVFILIIIGMFVFVLPNLKTMLTESGQELPFVTKIVFGISDIMINYGLWILPVILVLAVWLGRYILNTDEGKLFVDKLKLKMPIFGILFQKIALSRFSDSLSTLVAGGLPIVQAIEITSDVVNNLEYKNILLKTADQVKKGFTISSILKLYPDVIPPMVSQMLFVGEETGRLESVLRKVAKFYSDETSRTLDTLVTLIEPLLVVFLSGFVFILIAAVLIPFYSIAQGF